MSPSIEPGFEKRLKVSWSKLRTLSEFFGNKTVLTLLGMGLVNTAQVIADNETMHTLVSEKTLYWINTVLGILAVIFRSKGH